MPRQNVFKTPQAPLICLGTIAQHSVSCRLINLISNGICLASFTCVPFVHGLPHSRIPDITKEVCHENTSPLIASHRGDRLAGRRRNGESRKCLVPASDERTR